MTTPTIKQIAAYEVAKHAAEPNAHGTNGPVIGANHGHSGGSDGAQIRHSVLLGIEDDDHSQYSITASGERLQTAISGATADDLLSYDGEYWVRLSAVDAVSNGAARINDDVVHMDNFRHFIDHMWSSGPVSGGEITDNEDGTVTIAEGEAMLRETNGSMSAIYAQKFNGATLTLSDNAVNWITVAYVAGGPAVLGVTTDSSSVNCRNVCHLYRITREDVHLHIVESRQQNTDSNRQARVKSHRTKTFEPEAGTGVLSASGLALLVTSGTWWYAFNDQAQIAFDTSVAGTANANVFRKYWLSGSTWNRTLDVKVLSNEYNNAGTLTNLLANKYAVAWVYLVVATECHLAVVIGATQHNTQALAEAESAPSSLPPALSGTGVIIGRCVVKQGATTPVSVSSALTTQFQISPATDHQSLSGRDDSAGHTWAAITTGATRATFYAPVESATPDTPGAAELGNDHTFFYNATTERFESGSFYDKVRAVVLTGLSTATNAAITATDSVLEAFGKLQAQITAHFAQTSGAHGISAFGATLIDDDSNTTARSTLGLGGAAVLNVGTTAGTVAAGDHTHAGLTSALEPAAHNGEILFDANGDCLMVAKVY